MDHEKILPVFERIQRCPTAPFHEDAVSAVIQQLLAGCPHVSVESDDFGNLITTYRRGDKPSRLAFGAHMDHPGYVRSPDTGEFEFLGGVPERFRVKNPPIREFGDFAMWDLPEFEILDGNIVSRVCDDLVGCAAIVCLFQELERREIEATCHGLFTRAEEVGFVGAIQLAKNWPLGPDVRFISLETSAPVPGVAMGKGPVIRVGDRKSVFDTAVSGDLVFAAETEGIPVQRALLDLGSCEATAMQFYGIPSAGISVLLGNYHNCGPDDQIKAEFVNLDDAAGLIDLVVALVKHAGSFSPAQIRMGESFNERIAQHEKFADVMRARFG